eukprot:4169554-Lingulodinium_polyedra.AAC.1
MGDIAEDVAMEPADEAPPDPSFGSAEPAPAPGEVETSDGIVLVFPIPTIVGLTILRAIVGRFGESVDFDAGLVAMP